MRWRWPFAAATTVSTVVWFGGDALRLLESDTPSVSHGTPEAGSLEHGRRLPTAGDNFRAYSRLGALLGRNSVHETVRDLCLDAWAALDGPTTYVYGETGWPRGGPFWPHRTHENGLAVDFKVPVRDAGGEPAVLPHHPLNRWGYDAEFDGEGRLGDLVVDWEAMAAHLAALREAAAAHGARIALVVFDPDLQPEVRAARRDLRSLPWSTRRAWVRHDEHYHVVFALAAGRPAQ